MKLNKKQTAEMKAHDLLNEPCNLNLEPHVLTDKAETKTVGCRECGRPCIVTRFASAAKVACEDHRDRHARVEGIQKLDESKETHILTDKDKTKTVPCRHCGRPCVVTTFASAAKVVCNDDDCRKVAGVKRTTTIKPDGNGRMRESTKVEFASTADMQWSEFTLAQPFDISRVWDPEEKAEADACIAQATDHLVAAKKARQLRTDAEEEFARTPEHLSPDPKKAAKQQARITELEQQIRVQDEQATQQQDLGEIARQRANTLARIALIRGALASRYRLEKVDGRMCMVRTDYSCRIPDDFLDSDGYAQARRPVREEVAV